VLSLALAWRPRFGVHLVFWYLPFVALAAELERYTATGRRRNVKYKNIKSVAHNLGHSFLSDMNAATIRGEYVFISQRLFAAAAASRVEHIAVDFVTGQVAPDSIRSPELLTAVIQYAESLPRLLESQNVSPNAIVGARLTIDIDYEHAREARYAPAETIPEFRCRVELTDDRGIVHVGTPTNWWRQ